MPAGGRWDLTWRLKGQGRQPFYELAIPANITCSADQIQYQVLLKIIIESRVSLAQGISLSCH
jgi:hypothetical protein